MYKCIWDGRMSGREMRAAYCGALLKLGQEKTEIMTVDVDCMHSMGTKPFADAFPQRYINCGIQEANAVGIAAGLSLEGMIPFFNTFGVFATRRAYDHIFLSCGYAGLNVKLVGWDAGITAASNGGTHMPFEDVGIMRNIPFMSILEPADPVAMEQLVAEAAGHYGNVYIRSARKRVPDIYESGSSFQIGGSAVLCEGTDVGIIASGIMVPEALKAAGMLRKEGIVARVVDMYSIKPLDEQCLLESAELTKALVVAQNHNYIGGLYSAAAEFTAQNYPVPIERVCVEDRFGEVGSEEYLKERFSLHAVEIVKKAKAAMKRKRK